MRLSTVFELLIIALLIAFAASRVIDGPDRSKTLAKSHQRFTLPRQSQDTPARHCSCSSLTCNCCRDFALPIVPVKGPGCATVSYLHDDAMMITMSFGERVLRNITVNSKKPKPICMSMPGGISKFCGRLYNIKNEGDDFKACLGLELRALDDVEAALRVSCFKFGPGGVNVEPGEALPAEKSKEDEYDEDDDDYGLGALDDDDDDDDDFGLSGGSEDDDDEDERPPAKDTYNYVDSSDSDADYTGLSSLSEELFGGFFGSSNKKKKPVKIEEEVYVSDPTKTQNIQSQNSQSTLPQVNLVVMQPVILPATKPPKRAAQKRPAKRPTAVNPSVTAAPAKRATTPTTVKKTKPTTSAPVRTLAPSTTAAVTPSSSSPLKKKKKKKKPSRRHTTTIKPNHSNHSTDSNPTIVTSTTMSINVVQGGVSLNDTKLQSVEKPTSENPIKIPMSEPVLETKPMESIKQSNDQTTTKILNKDNIEISTKNVYPETTEIYGSTTQTVLQNTIPAGDNLNDNGNFITKKPNGLQNEKLDDLMQISTTPDAWYTTEETTNKETTENDEYLGYTNSRFEDNTDQTTELNSETSVDSLYETTTVTSINLDKEKLKDEDLVTDFEKMETTQSLNSATVPYYAMEDGTDKTEALTSDNSRIEESSSEKENENDDSDEEDDGDIDIAADLGFDDDDDDDEKEEKDQIKRKPSISAKPENKDDDDDDDMLGGLLDDDDDDSKTKEEERSLGTNTSYKINPLLYRLARVSSGFMATGRHFPRYSDGRNRRNNKRMRFASLEISP